MTSPAMSVNSVGILSLAPNWFSFTLARMPPQEMKISGDGEFDFLLTWCDHEQHGNIGEFLQQGTASPDSCARKSHTGAQC